MFLSSKVEEEDASTTIFPTTLSNEIASYGFMLLVSSEVQNTPVVSLHAPTSINKMKEEEYHEGNNALMFNFVQGDENRGGDFVACNNSTPPMSDYMNSTLSSSGYVEEHEANVGDVESSDMLIDNEALLRNNC
ncbi:unnamed protein product [Lupinus luteus]|uniref:Uncharacterized protein n=1 Tax=Lupinus luteus TaxID=3873 RepID=A0AAV1VVV3_LUPLU